MKIKIGSLIAFLTHINGDQRIFIRQHSTRPHTLFLSNETLNLLEYSAYYDMIDECVTIASTSWNDTLTKFLCNPLEDKEFCKKYPNLIPRADVELRTKTQRIAVLPPK